MKVIALGKKSEFDKNIKDYLLRLKSPFTTDIKLFPGSKIKNEQARTEDTSTIIKNISDSDFVILLDERGSLINNFEFLNLILNKTLKKKYEKNEKTEYISNENSISNITKDTTKSATKNIVFVIGGAYGVTKEFRETRANALISLSGLVLPHDFALLILIEQIYRSQCIFNNHPYHHQ